jgi:TRAP-type C4-dicarboxylate transport system permease small subunit
MIRGFLKLSDLICHMGAWLAGILMAGIFLLSLSEILARNFFNISIDFAQEYIGYMVAAAFLSGSGWALGQNAHIRVSLLLEKLPPAFARALDLVATIFGLAISVYTAQALTAYTLHTASRHEASYYPSATPLVGPQSLLALGFILLSLGLLARLLRLILREDV